MGQRLSTEESSRSVMDCHYYRFKLSKAKLKGSMAGEPDSIKPCPQLMVCAANVSCLQQPLLHGYNDPQCPCGPGQALECHCYAGGNDLCHTKLNKSIFLIWKSFGLLNINQQYVHADFSPDRTGRIKNRILASTLGTQLTRFVAVLRQFYRVCAAPAHSVR